MSKIEIHGKVPGDLLLETDIRRVDSWICIVLTKHPHAGAKWNPATRCDGYDIGPRRRLGRSTKTCGGESRCADYAKLLCAIVGNRSHLRQHVLSSVVDTIAGPQDRLPGLGNIPRKAETRLKFFLGTMQRAIRWECRIVQ